MIRLPSFIASPRRGAQRLRCPDPLPIGPGPLLALDAELLDVAPLPLGDGQGEVQPELVGGRGGIELPLGEDHQVDAGVRHVPDESKAVHGPPADAVGGIDDKDVSDLHRGPSGPGGRSWRPIRSQ